MADNFAERTNELFEFAKMCNTMTRSLCQQLATVSFKHLGASDVAYNMIAGTGVDQYAGHLQYVTTGQPFKQPHPAMIMFAGLASAYRKIEEQTMKDCTVKTAFSQRALAETEKLMADDLPSFWGDFKKVMAQAEQDGDVVDAALSMGPAVGAA